MQKILIILLAVFSLASGVLGYLNRGRILSKENDLIAAQSSFTKEKNNRTAAEKKLKDAEEKLAAVNGDEQKNASDLADLRAKAEKATADLAAAQKDLSEKTAELEAKAQQLAELEAKSKKTSQPNASVEGLKKQIEEKQQQIEEKDLLSTSLQNKLKDVEAQLSELRQREAQRRAGAMRNGLEGRILAVNSSWNFVVISLGDRNGVVNNAEMLIKRGSQLIGKIRITSVEPSTSVADIVANSVRSGMSVQPGDTVIYRGPGGEDKP